MNKLRKLFDTPTFLYYALMAVAGGLVGTGAANHEPIDAIFGAIIALNATFWMLSFKQQKNKGAHR